MLCDLSYVLGATNDELAGFFHVSPAPSIDGLPSTPISAAP